MKPLFTFLTGFRLLPLLTVILASSCSTLVGNVKPIDEKSNRYTVSDLSRDSRSWMKLDPRAVAESGGAVNPQSDAFSNEVTDLTYQSKKTAAIVSLNSSCRKGRDEQVNLRAFSQELVLGITSVKERGEAKIDVDGQPALLSTIEGTLSGERTKIRTVVLQKGECIYDLMYIARPEKFQIHEADFARFVSSLQVR